MSDAIVVGAGPNGLACAVALAREGVRVTVLEAAEEIGGGTRTSELTVPGVLHDHCSAAHPMASGSPFLLSLGLERHGLEWCYPEIDCAHPLDDGTAVAMRRSIDDTATGLGVDGERWKRLFGPSSRDFDLVNEDALRPILHVPKHPVKLTRFGIPAATPATVLQRSFRGERARALFMGVAAHAFSRLDLPMSSSVGMALICACHRYGWPVAKGGSRAITDALAAELLELDGTIETGRRVESLAELPDADAVVCDLAPGAVADLAAGALPRGVERAYRRYKHGPGSFKVDLAVEGGVPWTAEECRRAGTVHVAGSPAEIAASERDVNRGRMPERPFVLVAQQYLADPSRSNGTVHPVWAYAHVPSGWEGDGEKVVLDQIERFAPGTRERIVGRAVRSPESLADYNANYVGGDIITGANTPVQLLFRPRFGLDPYDTKAPGLFICSAATPPGAGVHGMNGANAAKSVLKRL